ncbi:hypothetical protein HPB47_002460 [Ixodes persulcatus]|uniref:Uncharacterized protein n=1 Tax=Ixodes persulcatus TaxID=34615 RepID=A0AC60PM47_IXOPE|nr:hypothetical protein HPB47_002460 [Ixodes persulcatus]
MTEDVTRRAQGSPCPSSSRTCDRLTDCRWQRGVRRASATFNRKCYEEDDHYNDDDVADDYGGATNNGFGVVGTLTTDTIRLSNKHPARDPESRSSGHRWPRLRPAATGTTSDTGFKPVL